MLRLNFRGANRWYIWYIHSSLLLVGSYRHCFLILADPGDSNSWRCETPLWHEESQWIWWILIKFLQNGKTDISVHCDARVILFSPVVSVCCTHQYSFTDRIERITHYFYIDRAESTSQSIAFGQSQTIGKIYHPHFSPLRCRRVVT